MSYVYETERAHLFTEPGVQLLMKMRDNVKVLLAKSGAFTVEKAMQGVSGSSWTMLAALDYLAELGEIKKVSSKGMAQHHIYTGA